MTQKHTPGPWFYSNGEVYDIKDNQICLVSYYQDGRVKANAALIAAAPDLLNAVEHLLLIAMETASEYNIVIIAAEHAIAKAYGVIE